jgi:hypothetical protein
MMVCTAGRWYTQWAGGDLVYITQLPHQIQNNTTHIAQDVRLRSQQPSQQLLPYQDRLRRRYDHFTSLTKSHCLLESLRGIRVIPGIADTPINGCTQAPEGLKGT